MKSWGFRFFFYLLIPILQVSQMHSTLPAITAIWLQVSLCIFSQEAFTDTINIQILTLWHKAERWEAPTYITYNLFLYFRIRNWLYFLSETGLYPNTLEQPFHFLLYRQVSSAWGLELQNVSQLTPRVSRDSHCCLSAREPSCCEQKALLACLIQSPFNCSTPCFRTLPHYPHCLHASALSPSHLRKSQDNLAAWNLIHF